MSERAKKNLQNTITLIENDRKPRKLYYAYPLAEIITEKIKINNTNVLNQLSAVITGFGEIEKKHIENKDKIVKETIQKLEYLFEDILLQSQGSFETFVFNFASKGMYLSEEEFTFIGLFYREFSEFAAKYDIQQYIINLGNNCISPIQLKKTFRNTYEKEKEQVHKIIGKNKVLGGRSAEIDWVDEHTLIGARDIRRKEGAYQYGFTKRVIAQKSTKHKKTYLESAESTEYTLFSIFNHGCMVDHSSTEIRNPFLRADFDRLEQKMKQENISMYGLLKELVQENILIYQQGGFSKNHIAMVNSSRSS